MSSFREFLSRLSRDVKQGGGVTRRDARRLLELPANCLHLLLSAATDIRQQFMGRRVTTCAIVNAKSGLCAEDCRFCAQAARHATQAQTYPLMSHDEILERAFREERHSARFGIVTSGKGLGRAELVTIMNVVSGFGARGLSQTPCASLGVLAKDDFVALKQAGLARYHHNLESSRRFFPHLCSTHSYEERVATIRAAQAAGLELCVGGILGVGESMEDRVDLLTEIRELDPDSVPLNFLVPISGTPLEHHRRISLWEATKCIALARFMLPGKDIKLGAGRLEVFRDAQHLVFLAGANGMIVGDLLTVKGRSVEDDLAVIRDLDLQISA